MQAELKDLLSMMDFFARLPRGKIINVTDRTYDDPKSWVDSGRRTWSFIESRHNTLKIADSILDKVIMSIKTYYSTEYYGIILDYLQNFKVGILNIPHGYPNDPDVQSEINVLITNINLQLNANNRPQNDNSLNKDIKKHRN